MASEPRPEAEQIPSSARNSGDFETLEIDAPPAAQQGAHQNGQQHTAIDVRLDSDSHQEQDHTRKESKAEETAGLLKEQPLSSEFAGAWRVMLQELLVLRHLPCSGQPLLPASVCSRIRGQSATHFFLYVVNVH